MNFRTFFLLLFTITISICFFAAYYPNEFSNILQDMHINEDMKFITLLSLILTIISYIGMVFSFFFAYKREKLRIRKLKEERINIDEIHAELESLRNNSTT